MPPPKQKKAQKWIWLIVVVLLGAAIITAGIFVVKEKDIKMQYNQHIANAHNYLKEMDYDRAEAEYLKAIRVAPKEEEPYLELAEMYTDLGEDDKADQILKEKENQIPQEEELGTSEGESTDKIEPPSEDGKPIEDQSEHEEEEQKEKEEKYTWVLEPNLDADDIYYVKSFDFSNQSINDLYCQRMNGYAVIRRGGDLGLIDFYGNINGGLDYKAVSSYVNGEIMLTRATPVYEEKMQKDWDVYWLKGDQIEPASGAGGGYRAVYYYYDDSLQIYTNDTGQDNQGFEDFVIPVRKVEDPPVDSRTSWWEETEGSYAVYADDKLVTDFIFEECGSYSNGLLAVKKDGKWGYVDKTGKIVIPIEYDASWQQYTGKFNDRNTELEEYCYAASEGYIALCKNEEWELRDVKGNIVIPPGEFQSIRPVYKGKCWVKKDGRWGVIQVQKRTVPADAVEYQSHNYKFFSESMTREEAEAFCREQGGYLASINTVGEQEFLNSVCPGEKNLYWIGLERNKTGWNWLYEEYPEYFNWAQGEPNEDFNGTEYYAQMYGKDYDKFHTGEWNDSRNDSGTMEFWRLENVGFICEWD